MSKQKFWAIVHEQAKHNALLALSLSRDRIYIAFILGGIYLVLVWTLVGKTEGLSETVLRIIWTLAPLLAFPVVYLYGFIRAPKKVYDEAQENIRNLKLQLDNEAARQNSINILWRLRSEGITLRNKSISSLEELEEWKKYFSQWRDEVLEESGKVNVNLKCYLERLDVTGQNPSNLNIFNPDHELQARIMSEILKRLQEYLKKEL